MNYYIKQTEKFRKSNQLLVSYKTFKEVSSSTIARWLKELTPLSLKLIHTEVHQLLLLFRVEFLLMMS